MSFFAVCTSECQNKFSNAFSDLNPCLNVYCPSFGVCKTFSAHEARCVCYENCPSYQDPVCTSNGTTYDSKCLYELSYCRGLDNNTVYHPGSCEGKLRTTFENYSVDEVRKLCYRRLIKETLLQVLGMFVFFTWYNLRNVLHKNTKPSMEPPNWWTSGTPTRWTENGANILYLQTDYLY